MKKLREIFWRYFVEKNIEMYPKKDEKQKFARMSWGVAPNAGDNIGYKLFGIGNFFRYLGIAILFFLFLISIFGFLFKLPIMSQLFVNLIAFLIGMGIAGGIPATIYDARYRLWGYIWMNIIAIIGFIITSFFLPFKYVIAGFAFYITLFILLYLFLTITDGGKDEEKGN